MEYKKLTENKRKVKKNSIKDNFKNKIKHYIIMVKRGVEDSFRIIVVLALAFFGAILMVGTMTITNGSIHIDKLVYFILGIVLIIISFIINLIIRR